MFLTSPDTKKRDFKEYLEKETQQYRLSCIITTILATDTSIPLRQEHRKIANEVNELLGDEFTIIKDTTLRRAWATTLQSMPLSEIVTTKLHSLWLLAIREKLCHTACLISQLLSLLREK